MLITLSFITTLWNIIIFLIVLGLVICIHELGHLLFAKRAGILCHEFSFGMGPRLWSKKYGETVFSIRAIPFGGFVSMAGEEIEADIIKIGQKIRLGFDGNNEVNRIILNASDTNYHDFLEVKVEQYDLSSEEGTRLYINGYTVKRDAMYVTNKSHIQIAPKDRSFTYKTKWQRLMTTFGGPLMNFVLALFVYLIIGFAIGVPTADSTVIGTVKEDMPSEKFLVDGDKILSINGVDVSAWSGESDSVTSELNKLSDSYVFEIEHKNGVVSTYEISPLFYFYGLGFSINVNSDDLIIENALYRNSGFIKGDEILSINGISIANWQELYDFALANKEGSDSKEDLYTTTVYRQTKSISDGEIGSIISEGDYYIVSVDYYATETTEAYSTTYKINLTETLLVDEGDIVTTDTALSSGSNYSYSYIVYGEDILNSQGVTFFDSLVGISSETHFSLFGGIANGISSFWNAAMSIFNTLNLLFSSNLISISDLSSFIGIFSLTSEAAANGIISLLAWIGLLSVNLGIVNLLPIPALDGGRIVFIGYEAITKRRPNQKVENLLHTIIFFLLIALLIFITYNDILRLFGL